MREETERKGGEAQDHGGKRCLKLGQEQAVDPWRILEQEEGSSRWEMRRYDTHSSLGHHLMGEKR